MSEWSDETQRRARKDHVCDECGTTIKAGDLYWETRGISDGSWWGHMACEGCYTVIGMACVDIDWVDGDEAINLGAWVREQGFEAIVANEHLIGFMLRRNEAQSRYAKGKPYDLEGNRQARAAWRQLSECQSKLIEALMAKHGEMK